MIAPTYYRSLLTPAEQEIYKVVVKGLLRFESTICIRHSINDGDSIQKVVRAVHLDHPELFYVDFWRYHLFQNFFSLGTRIEFRMLLEQATAESVANTLSDQATKLYTKIKQELNLEQKYYQLIKMISNSTTYADSGSAFWEHTAAGPLLNHKAVCEGIAKLFLFFCQRNQLPCAVISGTLNGGPHAWNMVETKAGIRYVDVTGVLDTASLYMFYPLVLFRTEEQLHQAGYEW